MAPGCSATTPALAEETTLAVPTVDVKPEAFADETAPESSVVGEAEVKSDTADRHAAEIENVGAADRHVAEAEVLQAAPPNAALTVPSAESTSESPELST